MRTGWIGRKDLKTGMLPYLLPMDASAVGKQSAASKTTPENIWIEDDVIFRLEKSAPSIVDIWTVGVGLSRCLGRHIWTDNDFEESYDNMMDSKVLEWGLSPPFIYVNDLYVRKKHVKGIPIS